VREMKRNVSVVRFKFRRNIIISGKIIKEMSSSVASGTHCVCVCVCVCVYICIYEQSLCSVFKHHTIEKCVAHILRLLFP